MSETTDRLNAALEGRYEILEQLGEGGMATVYLANDLRHGRQVAIKVLKPELAAMLGGERFITEIRTTANLQHPHILPLFDSGEADGFLFYVMPYVDGETLRQRLNRERQLAVDEAIQITRSVASALEYAHQNDVIHRDIKPENILIHAGQPVVADFGIALAVSAAGGGRMTETGLSLGTPHYMSPEQATADRDLSARSDVYALACVLYEMLAGDPPHTGPSAQAILMRILTENPRPVTDVRSAVPPHVSAALVKALEKLPADRFESAEAFAEALEDRSFTYTAAHRTPTGIQAPARPEARGVQGPLQKLAPWGVAALLAFAALVGWLRPESADGPVVRLDLKLGDVEISARDQDVVISPDGTLLAVSGRTAADQPAIFVRRLSEADFRLVPGTEGGVFPTFSPDGEWLAYTDVVDVRLEKATVSGGGSLTLAEGLSGLPMTPYWSEGGTIIFRELSPSSGTRLVPASGGESRVLGPFRGFHPQLLPDGSGALLESEGDIWLQPMGEVEDSSWVQLFPGRHPTYVKTGHILYVAPSGGLFAVPFDLDSHEVTGSSVPVLERVASSPRRRGYSVSRDGTLVYLEGEPDAFARTSRTRFVVGDFQGGADTLALAAGPLRYPRFSPDGRTIAYEVLNVERDGQRDIMTFDLVTGTNTQLTFEGDNERPVWSPDGTRLLFNSDGRADAVGEDMFVKPADNSGPAELVLSRDLDQDPWAWMEDGTVVYHSVEAGQRDLYIFDLDGDAEPTAYLEAPWVEDNFDPSPDGTLAAFVSAETGTREVWIRDFPEPLGKWRVSTGGGEAPRWSPDGQYVYFVTAEGLSRARVEREPSMVVRAPELVFQGDMQGAENWDLHPDGERFIITVDTDGDRGDELGEDAPASETRYLVVLNWFQELRRLLGEG